jgi:hypothetical protein
MSEKDPGPAWSLEGLSGPVLYDVFFEAGTMLGGTLVALERKARAAGDMEAAGRWRSEHLVLNRQRLAVEPHDRATQIRMKNKWDARDSELIADNPEIIQ